MFSSRFARGHDGPPPAPREKKSQSMHANVPSSQVSPPTDRTSLEVLSRAGSSCLSGARCWQVFGLASVSAFAGFLPSTASQPRGQCSSWRSFSLTAAGQSRIHTGFPIRSERIRSTNTGRTFFDAAKPVKQLSPITHLQHDKSDNTNHAGCSRRADWRSRAHFVTHARTS